MDLVVFGGRGHDRDKGDREEKQALKGQAGTWFMTCPTPCRAIGGGLAKAQTVSQDIKQAQEKPLQVFYHRHRSDYRQVF